MFADSVLAQEMPKENATTPNKREDQELCLPTSSPLVKVWEFVDTYFLAIGIIVMMTVGSQWPASGVFLASIYFPYICLALCFFLCGLRTKTEELLAAVKSYKAIVWGILTILLVVPILGTQITKTIQFATMTNDNLTTSESTVVGNVTAIGPTEFAFALQVFFVVPASMSSAAILVRTANKVLSNYRMNRLTYRLCNYHSLVYTYGTCSK